MILVRNVFQARFGKGGELAALMIEGIRANAGAAGRWRVLTDLTSGPFDTVVIEGEAESLADWEGIRARMLSGEGQSADMSNTMELIVSGHAEMYTIEGHS